MPGKMMIAFFAALGALASVAHAGDKRTYKMAATATRDTTGITIALKLTTEATDANGVRLTSVVSSPAVKIREGQEAMLMMNSPESDAGDQTGKAPAEEWKMTGVKITVFSIRGEDNVLVVGASLVKGAVIWDDAQRIPVRSKP